MTDQELKDIVAAVVVELEKSGVDFDYKIETPLDTDNVFVIRGAAPNYQGVTVTWKGLLDIITAQATQAKNDAETAKNAANTILEQVQSKGTEITNFVATSKTEIETQKNESVNAVKSVYQTDLDELKGDLTVTINNVKQELDDKKITKFYASNNGNTNLPDSDNGKPTDMKIFGKSIQGGTPSPSNPIEIQSVVNPVLRMEGKNLVNWGADITSPSDQSISNETKRTFVKGTVVLGLARNNYYQPPNIISYSFINNVVNIQSKFGYGACYVTNLKGKHKLTLSGTISHQINSVDVLQYKADGSFIDYKKILGKSFDTYENAEYIIIGLISDYTLADVICTYSNIQLEEGSVATEYVPYASMSASLPYTLNAIPVTSGGNVTIDGQQYIADYVDVERGKLVKIVDSSKLDNTQSIVNKTEWLLAESQEIGLTQEEVQTLKTLATHYPVTNVSVASSQLDGCAILNYPLNMANGWNYVMQQIGETRPIIYDTQVKTIENLIDTAILTAMMEA